MIMFYRTHVSCLSSALFQVPTPPNQGLPQGPFQSNVTGATAGEIGARPPPHNTVNTRNFLPSLTSLRTSAVIDQQAIQGRLVLVTFLSNISVCKSKLSNLESNILTCRCRRSDLTLGQPILLFCTNILILCVF